MNFPETRVLSGIQPSGTLHIGNYFGAMRQFIELQEEFPGECYFFIADYHALTTMKDGDELREVVNEVARSYLAVGVDPNKANLFRQSDIPEVCELTWLLSNATGMGLLERAHSYKDKVSQGIKPSVGLFTYPLLMASDIIIYDSSVVPVGKDQVQHVEMTQDIATHFNETFGKGEELLRRPEVRLSKHAYIPGIDGKKMSKSYGNAIPMFETGKPLRKLLGKIVTDSTPLGQPLKADSCNVFNLIELFADDTELEKIAGYYKTGRRDNEPFGYGHAKLLLATLIEAHFADAREKRQHLIENPDIVEDALQKSAARARKVAQATIERCKRACGLI